MELKIKEKSPVTLPEIQQTQQVTKQMCDDFLFSQGTRLNEQQKTMFYNLAVQFNLNPFKREIYAILYKNDFNIVTGYQVYIQRAEATRKLDGWHCEAVRNEKNELIGAKIIIYRKDFEHPFEWEVTLKEFDKGQFSWEKMPEFMIKKVCIGQGFRLAFPNELGGMPCLQEEIEGIAHEEITPPCPRSEPVEAPQLKNPDAPSTEKQQKAIHIIAAKAGIKEDDLFPEINRILREYDAEHVAVGSTKELTMKQASTLIDHFNKALAGPRPMQRDKT